VVTEKHVQTCVIDVAVSKVSAAAPMELEAFQNEGALFLAVRGGALTSDKAVT
jgi:hypothetical protein